MSGPSGTPSPIPQGPLARIGDGKAGACILCSVTNEGARARSCCPSQGLSVLYLVRVEILGCLMDIEIRHSFAQRSGLAGAAL